MDHQLLQSLATSAEQSLSKASPVEVLKWCSASFGTQAAFSTSFGVEDQLLTHLIAVHQLNLEIFTLDTGRLFPETYDLWTETALKYRLSIKAYYPEAASLESAIEEHGINLFRQSVELRKLCCGIRKVEPLTRALSSKSAWITGLRREQSDSRSQLGVISWDEQHQLIKVNPLWNLGADDLWAQVRQEQIPYSKLHDCGFPSIGCAPCTRAIQPGEHPRAGRWWWENESKRECGLHLATLKRQKQQTKP